MRVAPDGVDGNLLRFYAAVRSGWDRRGAGCGILIAAPGQARPGA